MTRCRSDQRQLPVIAKINVAQFQDINTSYGFDVGDALLQQTAQRLQALGPDLIARTGGDEFTSLATWMDANKLLLG